MLRLILVRHAKSAWDDPSLADFDRPLTKRGIEAAAWVGDTLNRRGLAAERVVCSTARRTRETLELLMSRMPGNLPRADMVWSDAVYARRDRDYLALIAEQGGEAGVLLVVGHNSAMEDTALALTGGDPAIGRFPTGGVAVIGFEASAWGDIAPGSGHLIHFLRPPRT